MLRIVLFMIIFYVIFGVIAVSQLKGRFYYCDIDNIQNVFPNWPQYFQPYITNKWDCFNSGSTWMKNYYNFDNMYQSLVSLFVISLLNGWSDLMYKSAQVT